MYCLNCGEKLPEGVSFCPKCGTKASSGETPVATTQVYVATQGTYVPPPPASGIAIAGFVVVFFFPLLGLILSYVGLSDVNKSNGQKGGRGLAIAGIVLGWVSVGVGLLLLLLFMTVWSSLWQAMWGLSRYGYYT